MHTSHFRKIPAIMGILNYLNDPKSILDIGAGFGKYGLLFREHLDIRKGRLDSDSWKTTIDAVEPSYKLTHQAYNSFYTDHIEDLISSLGEYDLILLADVLEYMDKDTGLKILLELYRKHCKQGIVVSYPPAKMRKLYADQPEPKSTWSLLDFNHKFNNFITKGQQVVYLLK